MKLGFILVLLVFLGACKPEPGTERAPCREDHMPCNEGLVCMSNLCVRPPPGDCALVADTLASFDIGNYAAPEERTAAVAKRKASCEAAHISKEEQACLEKAPDQWAAQKCAPRLFPQAQGDCVAVGMKVRTVVGQTGMDPKTVDKMIHAVEDSCTNDQWPADFKQCVLVASPTNPKSFDQCEKLIPAQLKEQMTRRMTAAMAQ
jgi:hypothetical protein